LTPIDQSPRARAVDIRTYCRPLDAEGSSFETRDQMLRRSMLEHHRRLLRDAGKKNHKDELNEFYSLGVEGKAAVSGRTQWLGGTPYAYDRAACQFNCSATMAATVYDIVDISWLLLNGCGVGFKPVVGTLHGYTRPINELEIVPSRNDKNFRGREQNEEELPCEANDHTWTIRVGDSAAAWAKAGGKMFSPRHAKKLRLDFGNVRGAGGRLKGYGWVANGYAPFAKALVAIHNILNESAGNLLDEIQIIDVVNWWGTVLSSRRAAEIALLDLHNPRAGEFARMKREYWKHNPQRRQSNNTLLAWTKPSRGRLEEILREADESGGDPGICNAEAALKKAPHFALFNPCVPGYTRILTDKGYARIDSLVGYRVNVWNGKSFASVWPKVTGFDQPLVKVSLSDGTSLTCTYAHNWLVNDGTYHKPTETRKQAIELQPGDRLAKYSMPVVEGGVPFQLAYTHGFYCGDGFDYAEDKRAWLYGEKTKLAMYLVGVHRSDSVPGRTHVTFPSEMPAKFHVPHDADLASRLDWFAGLLDSDGTVVQNPNSVSLQVSSVRKDFLDEVRLMLTSLGVQAKIGLMSEEGDREMPDGRGGKKLYHCQTSYRLCVNAADTCHLVDLGLSPRRLVINKKAPNRDARRFVEVVSVEEAGVAPFVYCFTEPLTNRGTFEGIVTGQCAEILLPRSGFCNLVTQCLPRFRRNFSEMERSCYLMARANYRQTCVNLEDGVLQPAWHQTNESLRLCGVSATGIVQADWLTDYQIRRLRNAAVTGAYSMADELKMPRPKAVTTVKPEGTISKTLGSHSLGEIAEGIHKPLGRFILNWVNFAAVDPLVGLLESAGYKTLPNPSDSNNVLVCFPVEYDNIAFDRVDGKYVNLEPATAQLDRYLRWNTLWADHNVSCTVSYSPEEIPQVVDWLDRNWDSGFIAVSFLRRNDPTKTARDLGHPYLPQEVVNEGPFRDYQNTLRSVDWLKVSGIHEISEESCATGVCPSR